MDPDKFLNYNSNLLDYAKENRKQSTIAEGIFWHVVLKNKQFVGYKFRRQKVVGPYILDFYCSKLYLGIEIDGGYHDETQDYDEERSLRLYEKYKIKVVRFINNDIEKNLQGVILYLGDVIKDREKELGL